MTPRISPMLDDWAYEFTMNGHVRGVLMAIEEYFAARDFEKRRGSPIEETEKVDLDAVHHFEAQEAQRLCDQVPNRQ